MEILKTRKATGLVLQERWCMDDVRNFCIRHDYYTYGCNEDYSKMLWYVEKHNVNPTINDIYTVALDIFEHSFDDYTDMDVTTIMYYLNKEVIHTFYYTLDELEND